MLTTPNFYTGRCGVKKLVCTPFQHPREAQAANPAGLEPKDRVAGRDGDVCHVWLVCVTVSLRCAISHVYTDNCVCRDPLRDTARLSARHETERSCTECRALPFQVKAVGTVITLTKVKGGGEGPGGVFSINLCVQRPKRKSCSPTPPSLAAVRGNLGAVTMRATSLSRPRRCCQKAERGVHASLPSGRALTSAASSSALPQIVSA